MDAKKKPIGFFDSGMGGIGVLRESIQILPNENYIFFGDSKNAPYGSKSIEEIEKLSFDIIDFLLEKDVKAIVVACNTATSAAIDKIRERHPELPVLGIEPALKPAVNSKDTGSIVVMATERTLTEKKFAKLMDNVAKEREIIKLPCPGLVELIEAGKADSKETLDFLINRYKDIDLSKVSAIVLGCTHYTFITDTLKKIAPDISIFDGSPGISRHLKDVLSEKGLLNDSEETGSVEVYNSSHDEKLLQLSLYLLTK